MTSWTMTPAATIARRAVLDLVRQTSPADLCLSPTETEDALIAEAPRPLPAVRAAATLIQQMQGQLRAQALVARGEGASWADVADALGLDLLDAAAAACAAYERVLRPQRPDGEGAPELSLRWRCETCGEVAIDDGPYGGGLAASEIGHAADCLRFANELALYGALWAPQG